MISIMKVMIEAPAIYVYEVGSGLTVCLDNKRGAFEKEFYFRYL